MFFLAQSGELLPSIADHQTLVGLGFADQYRSIRLSLWRRRSLVPPGVKNQKKEDRETDNKEDDNTRPILPKLLHST